MVGRGRLLVVNHGEHHRRSPRSATWVHHCIRTSAMTRCVFRRIIFFHELGRPFFCFVSFLFFFLFSLFFFWNATAYFAQFAICSYAPGVVRLGSSVEVYVHLSLRAPTHSVKDPNSSSTHNDGGDERRALRPCGHC